MEYMLQLINEKKRDQRDQTPCQFEDQLKRDCIKHTTYIYMYIYINQKLFFENNVADNK